MAVLKKLFKKNDANLKGLMSDAIEDIIACKTDVKQLEAILEQKILNEVALKLAEPKRPPISLKKASLPSDKLIDYILSGVNDDIVSNGMGYIIRKSEKSGSSYGSTQYHHIVVDFESMYGNYFMYHSYNYGYPEKGFDYRSVWIMDVYTQEELALMYNALDQKYKSKNKAMQLVQWYESNIAHYLDAKDS